MLPAEAVEGERAPTSGQNPHLVAVTLHRTRLAWCQVSVRRADRGGFDDPLPWNKLPTLPLPVVGEQSPEAGVVAQYGVEERVRDFDAVRIHQPRGVGFG